jgi:hypothetical protein
MRSQLYTAYKYYHLLVLQEWNSHRIKTQDVNCDEMSISSTAYQQ